MKKRILLIISIALIIGVFATSCYATAHDTCPAYRGSQSSHYKG